MIRRFLPAAAVLALLGACGEPIDRNEALAPAPVAEPPPAAAPPAASLAAPDFVRQAAIGDLYEIQSSRLALRRSQNNELRKYAQAMIDEHTRSTNDLKTATLTSGQSLTPPNQLDAAAAAKMSELEAAPAAEFDARYLDQQLQAHQAALELMQRYATSGDIPSLKSFAMTAAPIVQGHYDQARALRAGGSSAAATNTMATNTVTSNAAAANPPRPAAPK